MLRNAIEEVRGRRLLALAALGVLVALAVPLLFLRSAPEGAPTADTAAPAAAKEAKLPDRAARLLSTNDAGSAGGGARGATQDPFAPPPSARAAATAAAAGGAAAPAGDAAPKASSGRTPKANGDASVTKPIPVVVKNDGGGDRGQATDDSPRRSGGSRFLTVGNAAVDIRYGPKADTRIRRAIPRQKVLYIHGKPVAMFMKYSPSRRAAVFAIAPGVHISGAVKCRVQAGRCRYLEIPPGSHAWLTTVTARRAIVSRRLDVVRVKRRPSGASAQAAAARAK